MTPLQNARHAFRDARRGLAAAVLVGDHRATVAAAWRVLETGDHVHVLAEHPTTRDHRTRIRWRRWALQALRRDPPDLGLLRRAMALQPPHGAAGLTIEEQPQ